MKRPSRADLMHDIDKFTYLYEVASKYEVYSETVVNWYKQYGIVWKTYKKEKRYKIIFSYFVDGLEFYKIMEKCDCSRETIYRAIQFCKKR